LPYIYFKVFFIDARIEAQALGFMV